MLGVSFMKTNLCVIENLKSKSNVVLKRCNASVSRIRPYYFDYQATTPLDPRVLDKMMPYYTNKFGNSHSRTHGYGWEAEDGVELSRKYISDLINCRPKEIIFTSGATESNNTIIKGVCKVYGSEIKRHLITTVVEHKCVLSTFRELELQGYKVTYLPVDKNGIIKLEDLDQAIIPGETILVSIMHANNEIGVLQPLEDIGALCKAKGVLFHSDAAQSFGKIELDVNKFNLDFLSFSSHKIYGPKGIGGFYIRSKPRRRIKPLVHGGGQERGLRSGTIPVPLVIGLGEASRIALSEIDLDFSHVSRLYNKLYDGLFQNIPNIKLNGSNEKRIYNNLNVSFKGVEGESLIMKLRDLAVSSGSACTSASLEPSYVLRAIGIDEEDAHTSIRFGIGRFTTDTEIENAIKLIIDSVKVLREMSPLWESELYSDFNDFSKPIWT